MSDSDKAVTGFMLWWLATQAAVCTALFVLLCYLDGLVRLEAPAANGLLIARGPTSYSPTAHAHLVLFLVAAALAMDCLFLAQGAKKTVIDAEKKEKEAVK